MRRMRAVGALMTALMLMLAPTLALAAHHEGEEKEGSERKAWDQARMTDLSGKLSTATSELRRAFRKEPNFRNPGTPNQRAVHNMEQILRNLETATRQLRNSVAGGGDFEATRGTARRIGMLLNDADVESRRIMTSAFMAKKIKPAMELINEVAPYYGSEPLYDPETMQRLDRPANPDRTGAQE